MTHDHLHCQLKYLVRSNDRTQNLKNIQCFKHINNNKDLKCTFHGLLIEK